MPFLAAASPSGLRHQCPKPCAGGKSCSCPPSPSHAAAAAEQTLGLWRGGRAARAHLQHLGASPGFPIPRCLLPVVLFPKQRRKALQETHRPKKFGWRSHGLSAPPLHRKGCTRRGLAAGLKPGAYWQAKRMQRRRNPGGERRGHPAITVTLPCLVSL